MKLVDQLIETISKDLKEIENLDASNQKLIRKECNLIKRRIDGLNKLVSNNENADEIKQALLVFEKKIEVLLGN